MVGRCQPSAAPRTRAPSEYRQSCRCRCWIEPAPAHADTRSRADHLARAKSYEAQGRMKDARDAYTKCVDITPEMAYQLIKVS